MARVDVPLSRLRFGETQRRDAWWVTPLVVVHGLLARSSSTRRGRRSRARTTATGRTCRRSTRRCCSRRTAAAGSATQPDVDPGAGSPPAMLILPFPGGFRLTCYYYRGAYYKAFWADPPACAVGEPRKTLPRRALVPAHPAERPPLLPVPGAHLHRHPRRRTSCAGAVVARRDGARHFGIGVGTLVLAVNVVLLGVYTFGCHSLRHLVGGWHGQVLRAARCARPPTTA